MSQRQDPQSALGEVIRHRREELEMSQEQVALAAGTSQGRISDIECGDNPSFGLSARIAKALDWTHVELVRRVEEPQTTPAQTRDDGQPFVDRGRPSRGT
jgi:transcriptional regulator with XRE-family HTH domain